MLQHILRDISMSTTSINRTKEDWISEKGHQFSLLILILSSANVIAAILTIASIFYDAWSTKEWDFYPKTRRLFAFVPTVHPADVFPIIFLTAVIIQGTVLIGISVGESHSILQECETIAQVVWPALWIAPYLTLMFGLETTFRSLQQKKFESQGRWHIMICTGGALIMVLLTWIPSAVSPSEGQCLSSMIWWTAHYAKAGFAIASALIVAYVVCASVIIIQLRKTTKMDRDQRIQASTLVYYLIVTTLIISMVIPYYAQVIMLGNAIRVSKMAEVVLNLSAIIPAILRLLLRSNADWTMIQSSNNGFFKKSQTKVGATDLDMLDHMTSPISLHTCNSQILMDDPEKFAMRSLEPISESQLQDTDPVHKLQSPSLNNATPTVPLIQMQTTHPSNQNRANYSIFPVHSSQMTRESVSTMFSQGDDDDFEPPRPLFAFNHKRDLSDHSATVQIGLRLSNLPHTLESIDSATVSSEPSPAVSPKSAPQTNKRAPPFLDLLKSPSNDIAILPIYPNKARTLSQSMSPRVDLLSPTWLLRNTSQVNSKRHQRGEKDTMKSLPPTPPLEVATSPSVQRSPDLSRLASRHDIPTSERWI